MSGLEFQSNDIELSTLIRQSENARQHFLPTIGLRKTLFFCLIKCLFFRAVARLSSGSKFLPWKQILSF